MKLIGRMLIVPLGGCAACAGQCPPRWLPGGLQHPAFMQGGQIASVCRVGTDIVAAGTFVFTDSEGVMSRNAARWDGAAWHAMPGMLDQQGSGYAQVLSVASFHGQACIAGSFRLPAGWNGVGRWDGSTWESFIPPVQGWCNALTLFNDRLVVAGGSVYLPNVIVSVAAFDGAAWQPMWTVPGQATNLVVNGGDLYVAALETYTGPGHVYRWNGREWDAIPLTPGRVTALASHQGSLIAAVADTPGSAPGVLRWDGSAWQWLTSNTGLAFVESLASDGQSLYAAGYSAGSSAAPFVNAFRDGAWTPMSGLSGGAVFGLSTDPGGLWACGTFEFADGQPSPSVARWAAGPPTCPANCDCSTLAPVLNVLDFVCFLDRFAAADAYANCDGSTQSPVLNVNDFICFLNRFAAGCS